MTHDLREAFGDNRFGTILADPPWQFQNRTGKMAPEHRRLSRYGTMTIDDIIKMPVADISADRAHLYLWVPNALLPEGLRVLNAWGFTYKSNIVWHKIRKDGGPDGRGVGFYFRNTTELILFGTRGKDVRTLPAGRRQVNIVKTMKREHSRKPDEVYHVIEACSWGPRLELFARGSRKGWTTWGDQSADYAPSWPTYANHSANGLAASTPKVPLKAASLSALPDRKKPLLPVEHVSADGQQTADLFTGSKSGFSEEQSPYRALHSVAAKRKRRAA